MSNKHSRSRNRNRNMGRHTQYTRAIWHAIAAGLATTLPVTGMAADPVTAGVPARKSYEIPAGPLEPALNRFGREAGILLSFPTQLMANQRTRGLAGSYEVQEALARLLEG